MPRNDMSLLRVGLRRLFAAGVILSITGAGLFAVELAVRFFFPAVNFQDTDSRLLVRRPDVGYQWRPNTEGVCFGEPVRIDRLGCRDLEYNKASSEDWLVLGDSVAFGVGVKAAQTFAGRVERARPQVRILNAAVVGMNLDGQLAAARTMLEQNDRIRRITLFYCLNDLEDVGAPAAPSTTLKSSGISDLTAQSGSMSESIRGLLRSRSKLYLLLKGSLTDRSQTYFWCDFHRYSAAGGGAPAGLDRLLAIGQLAAQRGIMFEVVLLPYEYQLRAGQEKLWEPQRQVATYLASYGITCRDARSWLDDGTGDSRKWFLFGDPMHLSAAGHRAVASAWLRVIAQGTPQEHLMARPIAPPTTATH